MIGNEDTGSALRSLYEPEGGVRAIFASKVADYIASRPGYPDALFDVLGQKSALRHGATVADIGAGTGLLTQGLLTRGYRTIAVEPNPAMRAACDFHCGTFAGYRSMEGCAESIPLDAGSVDLVTAAQAFHWFEVERARAECLRVLAPHGRVALIWNDRVSSDPLHVELDRVFAEFGGAKRSALVTHEDRSDVPRFFGGAPVEALSWPHEHRIGEEGLACLAFSRSYMPDRATPDGQAAAVQLRRVFDRFQADAAVTVRYRTILIFGRPNHLASHLSHD